MSAKHTGILLDSSYDLAIKVVRDATGMILHGVMVGSIINQEAALVLACQQGEIKEDPILGASLTKFVRGKYNASQIEQRIRTNLARVDINYDDYKDSIITTIKTSE